MEEFKKTSLYNEHIEIKAKMGPFAGFMMPLQYTSVKEEVENVRSNAGIFDVGHMGEFFIEGPESTLFVDYLLPNDIQNAKLGKAIYSPLCNNEGKIIDDLIVYKITEEKLLLCVNASNIEKDWNWISSQAQKFKCEIKNSSEEFSLLALQGPNSFSLMKDLNLLSDEEDISYYSVLEKEFENKNVIIARTGYTGEYGFEIFCAHSTAQNLWKKFLNLKVTPCGLAARDVLRLEVCFPLYGHELTENLTPLDCGLKWTLKFNKEKFIGKEALEKATPSFQLIRLTTDKGIPREGHLLLDEDNQSIGKITSGTHSVGLKKGIALALLEVSKLKKPLEEASLFVQIRDKIYSVSIQKKPFIVGGHK